MNIPFVQDTSFTGVISTLNYKTSQEWAESYTSIQANSAIWTEAYTVLQANSATWDTAQARVWGTILGVLSAQTDLWSYLSAETFSPSQLTAFLATNALTLCSINTTGQILSAGTDLFDIFLTTETESQTLSYIPSSYELSISNGNTVNLSSINSLFGSVSGKYEEVYTTVQSNSSEWEHAYSVATTYQDASGTFATNTNLNAVSSLLTPLTLTNTLTGLLVLNTTFDNYQTDVANATATLLPTSIYQGASGFWQDASTAVQAGSSNWYSASGAALNAANSYTHAGFLPLSGGTISGPLYVLSSLYISGSAFYVNAQDLIVSDPIIYIAEDNQTDVLDVGIIASWTNSPGYPTGYQHGGLIRRADNKTWTLFSGATSEPLSGLNVEWSQPGILLEPLSAKFYGDIYGDRNVYGSLSSTSVVYASEGNSNQWNYTHTFVQNNSASWLGYDVVDVFGAGDVNINDGSPYAFAGYENSRPKYLSQAYNMSIFWDGSRWLIFDEDFILDYVYESYDNVEYPWLATNWNPINPSSFPSPTLVSRTLTNLGGLPSTIYKQVSGNWQSTYTTVQNNSATSWRNSKTIATFTATQNQPPSGSFATLDTRNSIAVLDFDDTAVESAIFSGIIPEGTILTSGLAAYTTWMATSATTGNVVWRAEWMRCNTNLSADSFALPVSAIGTTNAIPGITTTTLLSTTDIDGLVAGDVFRLRISRVGSDGTNDTMSGDAELVATEVRTV